MATEPFVYIVIVNWNGWKDTIECLESVFRLSYNKYKVVVCDNGSADNSVEYIRMWADRKLCVYSPQLYKLGALLPNSEKKDISYLLYDVETIESVIAIENHNKDLIIIKSSSNLGFAGANNIGLRYALKDPLLSFAWVLNNDTVVDSKALSELVNRTAQKTNIGICGSKLLYYHQPDRVQALGGGTYNAWFGTSQPIGSFMHCSDVVAETMVESRMSFAIGASMLVSKSFLQQVGLMAEDYFLYFEEIDWAIRGKPFFSLAYANSSVVYHKEGSSIGSNSDPLMKSFKADYYNIRNRIRFTRKHYPLRLVVVYLSVLGILINRLRRKQWDRIGMILSVIKVELLNVKCKIPSKS